MSPREFTINGRLKVVENDFEHGTWTVHDTKTGRRLTSTARLVSDLADLIEPAPRRHSTTTEES